jgi:hypothetical protein
MLTGLIILILILILVAITLCKTETLSGPGLVIPSTPAPNIVSNPPNISAPISTPNIPNATIGGANVSISGHGGFGGHGRFGRGKRGNWHGKRGYGGWRGGRPRGYGGITYTRPYVGPPGYYYDYAYPLVNDYTWFSDVVGPEIVSVKQSQKIGTDTVSVQLWQDGNWTRSVNDKLTSRGSLSPSQAITLLTTAEGAIDTGGEYTLYVTYQDGTVNDKRVSTSIINMA